MAHGKYLTMEEKRAIQAAFEANEHYADVAKRLNRYPTTIFTAYRKARAGTLMKPYVKSKHGSVKPPEPKYEPPKPWKPGDPKPDWLKRGTA